MPTSTGKIIGRLRGNGLLSLDTARARLGRKCGTAGMHLASCGRILGCPSVSSHCQVCCVVMPGRNESVHGSFSFLKPIRDLTCCHSAVAALVVPSRILYQLIDRSSLSVRIGGRNLLCARTVLGQTVHGDDAVCVAHAAS